uniref:Uncharacterized protein n=1 Tax=Arundo donax TaxID=35708 RepID=A0A0A9E9R8_ARUDO
MSSRTLARNCVVSRSLTAERALLMGRRSRAAPEARVVGGGGN